jgi:hypothetical protein
MSEGIVIALIGFAGAVLGAAIAVLQLSQPQALKGKAKVQSPVVWLVYWHH